MVREVPGVRLTELIAALSLVTGEQGQPAAWMPLAQPWESSFLDDRLRIIEFVAWLQDEP